MTRPGLKLETSGRFAIAVRVVTAVQEVLGLDISGLSHILPG